MKRKQILGCLFLIALIVGTVWILRFRGTASLRTAEGAIFGTTYRVKYEAAEPLDSVILAELRRVDGSLSVFNPQSTLSKVNRGETAKVDAMLYEVVRKSLEISKETDGAFDITVMPLVNAWGFGYEESRTPTDAQVDSLLQFVGYGKVRLDEDSVLHKADPRLTLDCGAIAKGYGVDRVSRVLREHGVRNYMVEIGGEVVTKGRKPDGQPWQIGVEKPVEGSAPGAGGMQTVLTLENAAVATSGNYRNYYERDGRKYAHTIDPRTGRPVRHSLLSATVQAPDCATADAYATAFMVLGLEAAKKVAAARKELKVYLIYADAQGKMQTYTNRKQTHER